MSNFTFDVWFGSCFIAILVTMGAMFGPLFTYFWHPVRKHVDNKTKQEIFHGGIPLWAFFVILACTAILTIASFFPVHIRNGDPEPLGIFLFSIRYAIFLFIGGGLLMHWLMRFVKPIRRMFYQPDSQIYADLFGS